ncbi:MAG: hydantoinase B/oxoprolinase family protein, partial [Pseudomonadota bacterium]
PPCKLVDAGNVNTLLLDIIKANSREPIANEGDLYALIACCEAGGRRLAAMMEEFGLSDLTHLSHHIIETSRRGTIAAISEIPAGVYQNVLRVDGYDSALDLHATLTVQEDRVHLDFAGTSPCSPKGINVPLNYATAYAVFALRCIIGSDIPNNAGSLEPFTVTGPPGCILNAQHPAPVAMRHTLGQMTPDLVFGCLHQAVPDLVPAEGASCMYDLPMRHTAETARTGGREFAVELVHNGGTGARPYADGLSATAFPSGVFGSQVEITEAVAPVTVWKRELLSDSGGAGKFRGGLGQRIELSAAHDDPFMVFLSVERINHPAQGRGGGSAGSPGRIRVTGRDDDISGKGELTLQPDERLIFDTPGGGGIGDPRERPSEEVERDLRRGLISQQAAVTLYGHKQ